MTRSPSASIWPPGCGLIAALVAALALILIGCTDSAPTGSARATAATLAASAESLTTAAGSADVEAARHEANAAALAAAAEQLPTAERIAAAADARVEAASRRAVADALARQAAAAYDAARGAEQRAQIERERDAAEADRRAWVAWCRWLGLVGICAGVLAGVAVAWALSSPSTGMGLGGALVASGVAALAVAESAPIFGWIVPGVILLGLVWWAWRHRRDLVQSRLDLDLGVAASRALDATEAKLHPDSLAVLSQAKTALGRAVDAAGRRPLLEQLRGPARTWTRSRAA